MPVQPDTAPDESSAESPNRLAARLNTAQGFFRQSQPHALLHAAARLADRDIGLESDDPTLFADFFAMFGGPPQQVSANKL